MSPESHPTDVGRAVGVLLVEDHRATALALRGLLAEAGYAVSHATSVAQAIDLLAARPDLILLDLMLPDGDGADVLTRAREEGLEVKVLVVTGAGEDVVDRVIRLKPHALLRKPVDPAALLQWVGMLAPPQGR